MNAPSLILVARDFDAFADDSASDRRKDVARRLLAFGEALVDAAIRGEVEATENGCTAAWSHAPHASGELTLRVGLSGVTASLVTGARDTEASRRIERGDAEDRDLAADLAPMFTAFGDLSTRKSSILESRGSASTLEVGQRVRVMVGAFKDKIGSIAEVDAKGVARVIFVGTTLTARVSAGDLEVLASRVERPSLGSSHLHKPRKAR